MIWLKLLSNPLTKLLADKTVGAIKHHLKKKEITRNAEIDAIKDVSIEQIKGQENSLKDEWITLVFTLLFLAHFIPAFQEAMATGWEILKQANDYYWIIILTIVGGSFGVNTINKFKK